MNNSSISSFYILVFYLCYPSLFYIFMVEGFMVEGLTNIRMTARGPRQAPMTIQNEALKPLRLAR